MQFLPYAKTPTLDKLAEEGVRFANAFFHFPYAVHPGHPFLTGRHPVANGHLGLATHKFLFQEFPTIFSLFKKAGYRTGLIGKLHVNPEEAFTRHIDLILYLGPIFPQADECICQESGGF